MYFNFEVGRRSFKNDFVKDFYEKEKRLSEWKHLEIRVFRDISKFFKISFDLSMSGHDHAGPRFEFSLLGFNIDLNVYDARHWDYERNAWKVY